MIIYTQVLICLKTLSAGIIKTDISDHFPIFIIDSNTKTTNYPDQIEKEIRQINDKNITKFRNILNDTDWEVVLNTHNPNLAYDAFIKQFLKIYNQCFPYKKIKIKRKSFLSPWITKGLLKSSKQKQKLYIKYLKNKTFTNEEKYKTYKNLFEKIKIRSKREYYSSLLKNCQDNAKKNMENNERNHWQKQKYE